MKTKMALAIAAVGMLGGTAVADEWEDPVGPALERFLTQNRAAGFDASNWISKRSDEVAGHQPVPAMIDSEFHGSPTQ